MKKKVLLTGAAGFVGRQILKELLAQDVSVRLVLRHECQEYLNKIEIEEIIYSKDIFQESSAWWKSACKGVDVVVHSAWYAVPGEYLNSDLNLECIKGSIELAKGSSDAGVTRFVGIGSCFEYNFSAAILTETSPLNPTSLYSASKVATYYALSHFFSLKKVTFSWCRIFYLYGEGEDKKRLASYIRAQLAEGKVVNLTVGNQIRDFLDVKEAGKTIAQIALSDYQGVANICSGKPVSIRQFAENIAADLGRLDLLNFGGRPENLVDPQYVVGKPYSR